MPEDDFSCCILNTLEVSDTEISKGREEEVRVVKMKKNQCMYKDCS